MFEAHPLTPALEGGQTSPSSWGGWRSRQRTRDVRRAAEEFRQVLQRERALAHRLHFRFSFLTLQVHEAGRQGYVMAPLLSAFRQRLRETDVVGVLDSDTLGVVLPATPAADARRIACEICRADSERCATRICQVVEYPDTTTASSTGDDAGQPTGGAMTPAVTSEVHPLDALLAGGIPAWKRLLDASLAAVALVVLSPLLGFIALTIKLVSPGPVFFRQMRVGHLGRSFPCLKFRSMRVNSDPRIHAQHLAALIRDGQRVLQKLDDQADPRLIPMGRLFRASGLDELPQLFNVLRGEMSLVGPRPCVDYEFRDFKSWQRRRCETPPGLTGFWQVNGKNRTSFNQMMRYDLAYVQHRSLTHDLVTLVRTPAAMATQVFDTLLSPRAKVPRHRAAFIR